METSFTKAEILGFKDLTIFTENNQLVSGCTNKEGN